MQLSFQGILHAGIGVLLALLLATTILGMQQSWQAAANLDIATVEQVQKTSVAKSLSKVMAEANSLFTIELGRNTPSVRKLISQTEAIIRGLEAVQGKISSRTSVEYIHEAGQGINKIRALLFAILARDASDSSCNDLLRDLQQQKRSIFSNITKNITLVQHDRLLKPADKDVLDNLERNVASLDQQLTEFFNAGLTSSQPYKISLQVARNALNRLQQATAQINIPMMSEFEKQLALLETNLANIVDLIRFGDEDLPRLRDEAAVVATALRSAASMAEDIEKFIHDDAQEQLTSLRQDAAQNHTLFIGASAVGMLAGLITAMGTAIALRRHVTHLAVGAQAFAQGNLHYRLPKTDEGPLGTLVEALNSMAESLYATEHSLRTAMADAEAASKTKTDFLARMSHEIRTPMNAIINLTDLTLEENLNAENQERLSMVSQSAHRLLRLINQVLDISKVEAGKMELAVEDFDPSTVIRQVVDGLRVQAEAKGLSLSLHMPDFRPATLRGDMGKIEQILINLVGNSIKFTAKGGVRISLAFYSGTDPALTHMRMDVEDTGIGIAPDKLESIFEAFNQADSSITRSYGGTGLGLSIAKQLAKLMGGDIRASSQIGKGTCFTVELPLQIGTSPSGLPQRSQPVNGISQKLNILVVDDNVFNQRVAEALLKRHGHVVVIAGSGPEALTLLQNGQFDLIFMDVEMAGMDGLEATRLIRSGSAGIPNQKLPVIAMTAHAVSGYREICLTAGMDGYVTKPINVQEMNEAILKVCTGD